MVYYLQVWDPNDLRMARFVDRDKQINTKFAIDLIAEIPPIACEERVVSCDGGGGPLGHPKVFINLVSHIQFLIILMLYTSLHRFLLPRGV